MSPRTRGPGAQHDERRTELADAVLAIVAEHGLSAVSQSAVAAQAGVSPGRVQHYFPAKRQLIEAAFDRANALSTARITAATAAEGRPAVPRDVLTVVLTELIPYDDFTRTHLRVRQAFTAAALADATIAARLRDDYKHLHDRLADLLQQDQEGGHLSAGADPHASAVALVALAEGLAYYVLIDVQPADDARQHVVEAIAGVYG